MMLDVKLLDTFGFFRGVDHSQREAIARCGEVLQSPSETTVFRKGDPADTLYGLLEGEVELTLVFEDRLLKPDIRYEEADRSRIEVLQKPVRVARVTPGQVFGWSALLRNQPRSLTAATVQDCRLIVLNGDCLHEVFEKDAALGYTLCRRLSEITHKRLRERTEKLVEAWMEAFGGDMA
jgi:CRP-like cAMP-binding protein